MRDLYNNIHVSQVLAPLTATTTETSSTIDLEGYGSVIALFSLGASSDTLSGSLYWTLSLQESNDNSTWTAVSSSETLGGVTTVIVNANSGLSQGYKIGYIGGSRYLRALITPTGSMTSGTPVAVTALLGAAQYAPVS